MTTHSKELLRRYQARDSTAATELFGQYVDRLVAMIRGRLSSRLARRLDADDIVQSAFRSFFMHARDGDYVVKESGDLWRLLASIALNKLHAQIERQSAGKRSIHREQPMPTDTAAEQSLEPTPAEAIALYEELRLVIDRLSTDERAVLEAMLQGRGLAETSQLIGKSERTTRRLFADVRWAIEHRFASEKTIRRTTGHAAPEAPLLFPNYRLERLIGAGGMGKVFRATEKATGATVAIKALHKSRQVDDRAVARFIQESQILATLRHKNIVGVQGLGQFPGGGYFLVMEYVDGRDLESSLRNGALPFDEALSIIEQIAAALSYAHEHGIVHCDLKPANVLLDRAGQVRLTDFGFAVLLTHGASKLGVGGTPGFIAPEVVVGRQPTIAADIYSLGRLLDALVWNESDASQAEPQKIRRMTERCVASEPLLRYPTVADFLYELKTLRLAM